MSDPSETPSADSKPSEPDPLPLDIAREKLLAYMLRAVFDEATDVHRRDSMARNAVRLITRVDSLKKLARGRNAGDRIPEETPLTGDELARRVAFLLRRKRRTDRPRKRDDAAT